jgi:hypothetical protein
MAKGSMKNIWFDRKRESERLQKLVTKKKTAGGIATAEAEPESTAELKPEETTPEDKQ